MVRPPLVRLKAFKDFSCRPFKVPQRLFKWTWTHAFQAGWGFEPEFRRQGFVYRGAAKSSQLMNSSNPILCSFFPGSVCTRRHARHTLPTLTFTLTFTLHLQIDGASSRSIERHFCCGFSSKVESRAVESKISWTFNATPRRVYQCHICLLDLWLISRFKFINLCSWTFWISLLQFPTGAILV